MAKTKLHCFKSCITDNSICGDYDTIFCPDSRRAAARAGAYTKKA